MTAKLITWAAVALLSFFLIGGAVTLFSQCQRAVFLDQICHHRSPEEMASAVESLPDPPQLFAGPPHLQNARINAACNKYLKGYLIALGGGSHLEKAAAIQNQADSLLLDSEFALAMDKLNERSSFCESVLKLPYLAEAYQRCAVAYCRQWATTENIPEAKATRYKLLAQQTKALANLFCRRRKYEIAERAFQDAIVSATTASRGDYTICLPYYYAYITFLCEHRREDDAEPLIEMLQTID